MALSVGLGHHGFWGYSSSFDFIRAISSTGGIPIEGEIPIRILLVNAGDIRHILTTISRRRRHSTLPPIHFYLLDTPIEVLARCLILLEVLHDFEIPIRQRVNIYLEIFGNVKVQERTSRYLEQLGQQLRSLVTASTSLSSKSPSRLDEIVNISLLRYRDKDILEECFKSYKTNYVFDIDLYWNHRLRGYYAERYDSRGALVDWDYHESIRNKVCYE